jgi:hypothetical protein
LRRSTKGIISTSNWEVLVRVVSLASAFIVLAAPFAAEAAPFPPGYEQAYKAYLAALPPAERNTPWLAKLDGVAAQPRSLRIGVTQVTYLFACKPHECDTNQTNIFLLPDRDSVTAVVKFKGVQRLIGNAGPAHVACVKRLEANGGVGDRC